MSDGNNKYPKEVFSALTSNKTISVTGKFVSANGRPDERNKKTTSPYKIYNQSFSLFKFSVLVKDETGKYRSAAANIKIDEVPDIVEMTEVARHIDTLARVPVIKELLATSRWTAKKLNAVDKTMKGSFGVIASLVKTGNVPAPTPSQPTGNRPDPASDADKKKAAQSSFAGGNNKGKTPYDLLMEGDITDPGVIAKNVENLKQQRDFLEKNLDKYKNNRFLIESIDAAFRLVGGDGRLKPGAAERPASADASAQTASGFGEIVLHAPVAKGNQYKPDEKTGLYPSSEIGIKWVVGEDYPIEITIRNYMAPIRFYDDGRQNTLISQMDKSTLIVNTYRLTAAQWANCLYVMQANMRRFENMTAQAQFKQAEEIEKENINETGAFRQQAQQYRNAPAPQPQGSPMQYQQAAGAYPPPPVYGGYYGG